jgi:membrane-associated phospholipid phosphatase
MFPPVSPSHRSPDLSVTAGKVGTNLDLQTMTLRVLALWILRMRISTTRIVLMLAVTIAASMATIIATGAVFAKIADDVVDRDGISSLDPRLSAWVVAHRPAALLAPVEYLTTTGEPVVLVVVSLAVGGALAWRRHSLAPLLLLVSASGGCVAIGSAIKVFVQRPRPPVAWQAVLESGFSFPSLHTLTSTATFGMLAYLSPRAWPLARRTVMWTLALAGALLIGGTRVFLVVHWPLDVTASFALGTAWLAVLIVVDTVVIAVAARRPPPSWVQTRPVPYIT